jgi:DNA-binding transcriptional regulator YiaG
MKYESDIYESDIAEMIHEMKIKEFQLGLISEAEMYEFDELCLTPEAFKEKYAQNSDAHETVNMEHADFVTAHSQFTSP